MSVYDLHDEKQDRDLEQVEAEAYRLIREPL
jgi:hypothetical protein